MNINVLEFSPHPFRMAGTQAAIFFANGYGARVITGSLFYTDSNAPYALAVLKGDKDNYKIAYDTPITNDVLGHLTANDVKKTLDAIAELKYIENLITRPLNRPGPTTMHNKATLRNMTISELLSYTDIISLGFESCNSPLREQPYSHMKHTIINLLLEIQYLQSQLKENQQ